MAIIKKAKETKDETKKTSGQTYTAVIPRASIRLTTDKGYLLVGLDKLDKDTLKVLNDAPVDIEAQDGVALFTLSRYARVKDVDGAVLEKDDYDEHPFVGRGVANIKLRHASYDWTYKKHSGHTDKLEVVGIKLLAWQPYAGDLDDLDLDGDDDVADLDELADL